MENACKDIDNDDDDDDGGDDDEIDQLDLPDDYIYYCQKIKSYGRTNSYWNKIWEHLLY